jgi:hypothetical protein
MTESPTTPPIACSLDVGSLTERLQEWRDLVTTSVESVDVESRSVRLVLQPSDEALVSAASLGQREKQCCAFFDVAIEIEEDRRALVLSVPAGAEEALATFVAALRP